MSQNTMVEFYATVKWFLINGICVVEEVFQTNKSGALTREGKIQASDSYTRSASLMIFPGRTDWSPVLDRW